MSTELDTRLERAIDRELKGLPELAAPATLAARVLARIEPGAAQPWYRQSWQMWPVSLQAASLVLLLGLFGGLCAGAWQLPQLASVTAATRAMGEWFSGINALCSALNAVLGSAAMLAKQTHTALLVGCLAAAGLGYGLCVGLMTIYVRLALVRR